MSDRTPPLLDRVREYCQEHPLFQRSAHLMLDRVLGTMVYFHLEKP